MGIPTLFRKIVSDYPDTHFVWRNLKHVDYFYIDFNAIIYNTLANIDKKTKKENYEKVLLKEINKFLQHVICEVVRPKKGLYIAFDGSVPRAKMMQQRFRRFKGVKETEYKNKLKEEHGVESSYQWDSRQISPGTEFMDKVSKSISTFIKKGELYKHGKIDISLSDTLVPGEGEHKFMPEIKNLVKSEPDATVVIQSPDADLIVLSIASHKSKIYLLRPPDSEELMKLYEGEEYLYLDIDVTKKYFLDSLVQEYEGKVDKERSMIDFVFLTFMAGNDFIIPAPYLKIKEGGLNILTTIYKRLFVEESDYLINKNLTINLDFLRNIVRELAENEDFNYRKLQKKRDFTRKKTNWSNLDKKEANMTEYEKAVSRYEHTEYYSSKNPFFQKYNPYFNKINYFEPNHVWKTQYYRYFFNLDKTNNNIYNSTRSDICKNYIESLVFNLKYYFKNSPPSWHFFYRYRVAPVMSDLYTTLSKIKSLDKYVIFKKDVPYKPFEQLMLILPPQSSDILPTEIGKLMKNPKEEIIQYYPIDVELDVVAGIKHIYSEPLLPVVDADKVVSRVKELYPTLTPSEKKRNVKGKVKKFIVKK
jgi:5'-3' exonuclease